MLTAAVKEAIFTATELLALSIVIYDGNVQARK